MPFVVYLLPLVVFVVFPEATGAVQFTQDPQRKFSPPMNCYKYFVANVDDASLRQSPGHNKFGGKEDTRDQHVAVCRHKISKSHEGLKVEMSSCLDSFSNGLRGMHTNNHHRSNSKSRTGTNGFAHNSATTATRNTHDDNTIEVYLDKSQLQELLQLDKNHQLLELLQQKTISETNTVFVVVDCKIDKEEVHHHHRHLTKQKTTSTHHQHEKSYLLYFLATMLVAFFISRLKVNVELRLDVGGAGEPQAGAVVEHHHQPTEPDDIIMAEAIVINAEEQHAVPVYG